MKSTLKDYVNLTIIAGFCGLLPSNIEGKYYFQSNPSIPIDLSACAEDEKSIYRTAIEQLLDAYDTLEEKYEDNMYQFQMNL